MTRQLDPVPKTCEAFLARIRRRVFVQTFMVTKTSSAFENFPAFTAGKNVTFGFAWMPPWLQASPVCKSLVADVTPEGFYLQVNTVQMWMHINRQNKFLVTLWTRKTRSIVRIMLFFPVTHQVPFLRVGFSAFCTEMVLASGWQLFLWRRCHHWADVRFHFNLNTVIHEAVFSHCRTLSLKQTNTKNHQAWSKEQAFSSKTCFIQHVKWNKWKTNTKENKKT